jgi:flagellar hook-associated protein 3 FlgL
MRVSDIMMQSTYLSSISKSKEKLAKLQQTAANGKKISVPSDSPFGAATVLSLQERIGIAKSYVSNMENVKGFLYETENNLNSIESEISKVLNNISLARNSTEENLNIYADQIDLCLKTLLEAANAEYEGKYLFGGTDYTSRPYGETSDGLSIEVKADSVSGEQKINISQNIQQKVNITGAELFSTILKQNGTLDSSAAVGTTVNDTTTIYNAEGTAFTLNVTYEKTAANTYDLTYDILDGSSTSIYGTPPAAVSLEFNSSSGRISSINGSDPELFNIKDSTNKIDFNLDFSNLKEVSGSSGLSISANQNMDIFNRLITLRDNLAAGNMPSDEEFDAVKDFYQHVLDKLSQNGNMISQLEDTTELMNNRILNLEELLSKEQDVDEAEIIMEIQNQDYQLQLAYKLSSMILPKSLLDYL